MGRIHGALGALLAALLVAQPALAALETRFEGAPFELTADRLEYERKRDVYVARGNVRLVQRGRTLSADWISFSRRGARGVASGNVVYTDGDDAIRAQFVQFDLSTLKGVLFVARFDASQNRFRMEAEEIVKTGNRTYTFEEGLFTTCRCPGDGTDPWQIRASSADLEVEGYAVARNSTLNILGVPIVWLPWMLYPIKTERDTGLLFPEFGYRKRTGFEVGLPLFWAAAPNLNLTLTPRWLSKRGVKGEVDAEYVFGEKSSGETFVSFIYDDDVNEDSLETPYDPERWIAKGEQDFHLPHGWRLQSEFDVVSDNAYSTDFTDVREKQHDRFLQSNAFLTKHFNESGDYGFVASVLYADDLQNPDDQDRDDFLLQRFPDARYLMLPSRAPWLEQVVPSFDVEYAYFARFDRYDDPGLVPPMPLGPGNLSRDRTFYDVGIDAIATADEKPNPNAMMPVADPHKDDFATSGGSEGNGRFDEGEPLADRGHRVKLNPRLAIPGRLGDFLELYPEVGWRQTFYDSDLKGGEQWGALTGRVDLRTRLSRRLGSGIAHILEPRVGYAIITKPSFGDDPIFTPDTAVHQTRIRQLYLDNVTREGADRFDDFNGITWGVGNRFYRRASAEQGPRLLADFVVLAQYDFANGGDLGDLVVDGTAHVGEFTDVRFNGGFDPEDTSLEEALAEALWRGERLALRLRYRYLKTIPRFFENFLEANDRFDDFKGGLKRINQIGGAIAYRLTDHWLARYEGVYEFDESFSVTHRAGVEYLSRCDCWALGVEARTSRRIGFEVAVVYRVVGLGNDPSSASGPGLAQFSFLDGI